MKAMRSHHRYTSPAIVVVQALLVVATFGCQAEDPELGTFDSGMGSSVVNEPRASCPQPSDPNVSIARVEVPPTTSATVQAVRGTAIGASDVLARVGGKPQTYPAKVSADGRFCLDITLAANTQTEIDLVPRAPDGCEGRPERATIVHQYAAGGASPPSWTGSLPTPQNVALGKSVQSDFYSASGGGGLLAVTDGRTDTYAVFSVIDVLASRSAWLSIDLGQVYTVSAFRVHWNEASRDEWATDFGIYVSSDGDPGDPTLPSSRWRQAANRTGATRGMQDVQVGGVAARWVALVLRADNTYLRDVYHLAELGVYVAASAQAPLGTSSRDVCP